MKKLKFSNELVIGLVWLGIFALLFLVKVMFF